jgi:hypothetical protein
MPSQRDPNGFAVRFLTNHSDYRFSCFSRKALDIDEIESTKGDPAEHNNVVDHSIE